MINKEVQQRIEQLSKKLHLPVVRKQHQEIAQQASQGNISYQEYLLELLEREVEERVENRRKAHVRQAGFTTLSYLHELKSEELPADGAAKLPLMTSMEFITNHQNIILAGSPGTGKTHIATALGIKACQAGLRVYFVTVARLLTQIRESRSQKTLRALENRFEKYDLVICDEFGYVSFDKEGAELLFTHLSLRNAKKSTIITTNLSFDRWAEMFGNTVLAAAMVDRLTHKAILVDMVGPSYRSKETAKMIAQK